MYSLMLVDDEPEILEGLMEIIPFEAQGFRVIATATNGAEGLSTALATQPDLVLTDIQMPLISGLDMSRAIKAELPMTQFIFLSGFDEFDYARQALEVGSLAYLLKPINADDFRQMLARARQTLDEAMAQKRDLSRLRSHYEASLPILREGLLNSLLTGGLSAEQATDAAQRYDMPLSASSYRVALIRAESLPKEAQATGELRDTPELMSFAIKDLLEEPFLGLGSVFVFHFDGMLALLFAQQQDAPDTDLLLKKLDQLRQSVWHYYQTRIQAGLSATVDKLSQLPAAAAQARSALNQSRPVGGEEILSITDLEPGSSSALSPDEATMSELGLAIKTHDLTGMRKALAQLMQDAEKQSPRLRAYRGYLLEIMMGLFHIIRDMDIPEGDFDQVLSAMQRLPAPGDALPILNKLCDDIADRIKNSRADTGSRLAQSAQEYLRGHFHEEDLSLETLCRHLHISPSYFSLVYKKETGKTFHQTLTELRMNRALSLLTKGDMKTAQIAQSVGISDPSYFSYAFRKFFGFSPSQARQRKTDA